MYIICVKATDMLENTFSFGILFILLPNAILKFPIPVDPAIPLSIPGMALDRHPDFIGYNGVFFQINSSLCI